MLIKTIQGQLDQFQLFNRIKYLCSQTKPHPIRKIIKPQSITVQNFDSKWLIKSNSFEFVSEQDFSRQKQISQHFSDTPASLLTRSGIHIFNDQLPELGKRQKYSAFLRKLKERYQKSYDNKSPAQIFHLERKIKNDMLRKSETIGFLEGKYRHYRMYRSMSTFLRQKTMSEYEKKGLKVQLLGATIYPKGQVWLPTSEDYLKLLIEEGNFQQRESVQSVLDIGCGSGILSFIASKMFKKARVVGLDINPSAVQTSNINAATLKLNNFGAYEVDVRKQNQVQHAIKSNSLPENYDYILANPPWVIASPLPQSPLSNGVYDEKGQMLKSIAKTASKRLKNKNSRLYLIYSDLSKVLQLQKQSVEDVCSQNNLVIHRKVERLLAFNLQSQSPLNIFKQKSKIQLYQIGLPN